ncbi:hypothetical protein [Streptomyces tibetensis]|uniref:hypothetical protein n=1 Tax=Streptomyces tibetensis TaxID=2382123 RepID=UPI0034061A9F
MNTNRTLVKPRRMVGDFDCSGEDIERDWMARTGCWSHTERVLLTYEQVRAYELPATEGKRGDPRWPAFARQGNEAGTVPADLLGGGGAVGAPTAPTTYKAT